MSDTELNIMQLESCRTHDTDDATIDDILITDHKATDYNPDPERYKVSTKKYEDAND